MPRLNAYEALKYTIENHGGTIGGSGETVTFHEDITIESGKTLTIVSGTTIKVAAEKKITVEGTLNADDVMFRCANSAAEWVGLEFNGSGSNSSELVDCVIQEVETGISIISSNMTVESTEIYDALDYGIYIYGGTPEIYDCYIHDIEGYGIAANAAGSSTFIQYNSIIDCEGGVYAYGQNSIKLRGSASRNYGKNKISSYYQGGNDTYGIYVTGGTPDLGQASPTSERGKNDFIYNTKKIVYNTTASEVVAEKNYWGGTPQSSWFYGSVGYDPYYSSSQGGGSSLGKGNILVADRQLLAAANELNDSRNYHSASATYKQLVEEYPDSRYAGIALAWAMAAHNEANDLMSQRAFLQEMTKHKNPKVSGKAWLWLQTLEAKTGEKDASGAIVKSISIEDPVGIELRLNWANDLYNIYGDAESAQKIFDELITAKAEDQDIANTIKAIIKTARTEDYIKSLPKLADTDTKIVKGYALRNYPNPFNPTTTIQYHLAERENITLQIYDVLGRRVRTLIDGETREGAHTILWDGRNSARVDVAAGIYFASLKADNNIKTIKLLLVR